MKKNQLLPILELIFLKKKHSFYKNLIPFQSKANLALIALLISCGLFLNQVDVYGQIAQRGTSTFAETPNVANNSSLTIPKPTGVVAGDVLIANIVQNETDNDNGGLSAATASGWLLIDGRIFYSEGTSNGNNAWYGTVLYRVADGLEGAAFTFNLPNSRADMAVGSIMAFSGVDVTGGVHANGTAGGPFDVDPGILNIQTNPDDDISTGTGITTVTNNAAVIMLAQTTDDITFNSTGGNQWRTGNDGNLTEILERNSTRADDASIGAAWITKAIAGNTGIGEVRISDNERRASILLALRSPRICAPLSITSQSTATQTTCIGEAFNSISVTASGTELTYQWYSNSSASTSNGTIITGATSASYTPPSTSIGTTYYYVVVGDSCGASRTSAISGAFIVSACPCFTVLDNGALSGVSIIQFNANCTWEAPEGLLDFEVLVIGGGGGGGYGNGGGGGGAGIVHARVDVEARLVSGLPAGSIFQIQVGKGGDGSTGIDIQGENGVDSSFDLDGLYRIIAGGGGGGGSEEDDEDSGFGGDGRPSEFNSTTVGFSSLLLRGGSGGGGADGDNDEADDIRLGGQGINSGNGGNSIVDESGSGGGGAEGNGQDSVDEDGGNGGDGEPFSIFDIFSNRVFGAGGGGGGQGDLGNGGSGGSGGAGGEGEEDDDPLSERIGRNGTTPGSGGGGGAEEAAGGNGARGMVFIRFANSRILPVEYVSLEAEFSVEERQTELTWTTSMERENSHFEVQRSTDGLKSWDVIGNVEGMGWSDAPVDYRFEDVNPTIAGGTVYYRLNQVDFDGTSSLSKVLSVKVPGVQFTQGVWRAYPNPTSGEQLRVSLLDKSQYSGEGIAFKIIHPTSISKAVSVTSENEMNEAISQMIRNVPKGVFVIELTWGQKIEHIKVLKK